MNSPLPSECSQLDVDQSRSGSKRSAEELQLPVLKERTVARKETAGLVVSGESTRLQDQPAAEPSPSIDQSRSGSKRSAEELQLPMPKKERTVARKETAGLVVSGESTRLQDQPAAEPSPSTVDPQSKPEVSSTSPAESSNSGSKRSAEELELPVCKKRRTVSRKVSAGQVAAGESTRLPGQSAEPSPSSVDPQSEPEVPSTTPAESSATDLSLSAGMQIEAPLRDSQGPLMITGAVSSEISSEVPQHLTISVIAEAEDEALVKQANQLLARAESAESKLVEVQKRCAKQEEDRLAAIAVQQEQVESLKEKNNKLLASLNALKDHHKHTQHQVDQALQRVETLRTQLEAKRNMRHCVDSKIVAGLQQIRKLRTSLEMLEAQKEKIKVAATPILKLVSRLSENQASKPFLDQLRKVPDLILVYCKKIARVSTLQVQISKSFLPQS